ncbi:MAG: tRNA (adenosine(37)-N6)-dimethylallyltransferase MiaA [Myxococcales bacterium]|nr:MAG: tRNA (adenosine(37)-N6)-dimethylallyltransferase MiaA [Myxococcales bacterium]
MKKANAMIVIAGPTGTGKTQCAIEIAKRFDAELVGADSVQVYRGFDIGSAKPTESELQGIKHHLIDAADPDAPIDAVDYAKLADQAIADIHRRGKTAIVVGGTGLWLRALLRGLLDLPKVDAALREMLTNEAHKLGTKTMHTRLAQVDPIGAKAIHENDTVRIVRALEVYEQTGQALGKLREEHALGEARYDALHIFLDDHSPEHQERLNARADRMIEAGWLSEIEMLLSHYGPHCRALGSVGYRQLLPHLLASEPLEESLRKAKKQHAFTHAANALGFAASPILVIR